MQRDILPQMRDEDDPRVRRALRHDSGSTSRFVDGRLEVRAKEVSMKRIAFPTDNGETISRHLGEAPFYLVVDLDDAGGVTFEKRQKPRREHEGGLEGAGKHAHLGPALFAPVHDCQVLIAGGMGRHAYDHAVAQGLEVILPRQERIDDALQAYRAGTLESDMRRVHKR